MTEGSTLVAADVRSTTERRLVEEWAADAHPGAPVVALEDDRFPAAVEGAGQVVPARVTWLPDERGAGERLNLGELLLLSGPRRPWRPLQELITRRRPDGAVVTTGTPASTEQLRGRFLRRYGDEDHATARFPAFVARQAVLACDRAERQVLGNRYKVPRLIAEQLLDSTSFDMGLRELAGQLGRDIRGLRKEAKAALEELIAVQSPLAIDVWRTVLRPMHAKAWNVEVDDSALDHLRELNRGHSLIFLPSHRSYVDPLIIADVLLQHDLPRNHTLGGANLSFWPFGPLGKRAGIVFIRRSFGGDEVYKFAVRRYLGHLMAKKFNLEWFMEGGRTRTGKLRRPRYGILRYLVDGLDLHDEADPIVVPVSLVYEQLHEVASMAEEEQGGTKQAEGLAWFARYVQSQQHHLGDVLVRFGQPMSLRDALSDAGEGPSQLEKVAFEVATRINDMTPATSTSLVCLALLGERDRALTVEEIGHRVTPLLDYLDMRGIERPKDDLRHPIGLCRTLGRLQDAGVVEVFDDGPTPIWSIRTGRHHTAAFYRNGALHHLLNRAIVELVVLYVATLPDGENHLDLGWEEALRLRDLLKFEFFFPTKARFRDELEAELQLLSPTWNRTDGRADQAERVLQRALRTAEDGSSAAPAGPLVAHHVLRSFIDAQVVTAAVLVDTDGHIEPDTLVDRSLSYGQQMLRQRRIHGAESVSRELFGGTALLADNRSLLDGGPTAAAAREAYREELDTVVQRLQRIADLDRRPWRISEHTVDLDSPAPAVAGGTDG